MLNQKKKNEKVLEKDLDITQLNFRYDALQDKKDKVSQKHLCKKILEYLINEIDMLYN